MSKHPEKILGIPRARFEDILGQYATTGFRPLVPAIFRQIVHAAEFRVRDEVEEDQTFKQIIPYLVLRHGDNAIPGPDDLVFTYARGEAGGEGRLVGRRSLGIGGHVEAKDMYGEVCAVAYRVAALRELREEVDCAAFGAGLSPVGYVNDDTNPVGSVHIGMVHLLTLDRPRAAPKEEAIARPGFLTAGLLKHYRDEYETWSQLVIDALWT